MSQLTCEMNQLSESDANRSLTKHRKIASSFRDSQLFEVFQLSSNLLRTAYDNRKSLNFNDESQVSGGLKSGCWVRLALPNRISIRYFL